MLVHGLGIHTGFSHPGEMAASEMVVAGHTHDESVPAEHGHCADCLAGHVMAACIAIFAVIGSIGLTRRLRSQGHFVASVRAAVPWARGLVDLARPPGPAWVRLSVMRC
jgi:hypothetical protein